MDDLGNLAAADDADLDDSFGFRGRHDDESRVMRGRITESRGDIHPRYLTDAGCHDISMKELYVCSFELLPYYLALPKFRTRVLLALRPLLFRNGVSLIG